MAKFELHGDEKSKANEFVKKHKKCRPRRHSIDIVQYAPFSYIFTPTGIGIEVEIK
jgi:hypothetical protein